MFLKKGRRHFKPADFMLFRGDAERRVTQVKPNWQQQLQTVQILNAALGGKDLRGEK
jgi:hypothetical protein